MYQHLARSQVQNNRPQEPDVKETLVLKMWDIYDLLHREDLPDKDNLPLKYVFAIVLQIIKRCKSGYVPCDYKSKILSRLDCIKRVVEALRNNARSSIVPGSKYEVTDLYQRGNSDINSNWISDNLKSNCNEWWPSKIFINPNKVDEYQYTNVRNILKTYAPHGEFLPKTVNPDEDYTIPIADISKNTTASPTSVVEGPYGFPDEPEASIVPMPTILAQNVTFRVGGKGRKSKRTFFKRHKSIKKSKRRTSKKIHKKGKASRKSSTSKTTRKGRMKP
jgi:hypothetical protein